jgi:hypothetical protein
VVPARRGAPAVVDAEADLVLRSPRVEACAEREREIERERKE